MTIKLHVVTEESNVGKRIDLNPDRIIRMTPEIHTWDLSFGNITEPVTELLISNGDKLLVEESLKTIRKKIKKKRKRLN